jgi:hypothetical protein
MSNAHAFFELFANPTDLEDWIAALCGREVVKPQIGPAFPALSAAQSADDWLVEQFYALSDVPGARDRLRHAIITLIATHGGRDASPDLRDQIVGTLLHVAGTLNFIEVSRHLVDWARQPWLKENHVYRLRRRELPLRQIVWDLLLAWGAADDLGTQLESELVELATTDQPGTAQLAFIALGRRSPAKALTLIPRMAMLWHLEYWENAVIRFFRSIDVRVLLGEDFRNAWVDCIGSCLYEEAVSNRLREERPFTEADSHRANHLCNVLDDVGISLGHRTSSYMTLQGGGVHLQLDVGAYLKGWYAAAPFRDETQPVQTYA